MTQPPYGENPDGPPSQPGQPTPYGTPPGGKKSRAGLIGLVVLAVLLIAGGALAAVLLLSDSDKDDKDKAEDKTSEPTDSASSEAAGDAVQGSGYSYTIAEGWNDATEEADIAAGAMDTVAVWGEKFQGGRANVIVESGPAGGQTDAEALRSGWESNMAAGAKPKKIDGTTIDGEQAIGARIERTNENGVAIVQTAYLLIHDDSVYSIALSGKAGDDDALAAFEGMLASWTWE